MSQGQTNLNVPPIPPVLEEVPECEFSQHRDFILRNTDFLINVLTAEQYNNQWQQPAGCPSATPAIQARRRSNGEKYSCRYETITRDTNEECACGDTLVGSDDPLDTVAAVAIANNQETPGERYFDTEYREIIHRLRENVGGWEDIAALDRTSLARELEQATNRPNISDHRVSRLETLLEKVDGLDYSDGVTLKGVKGVQYKSLVSRLVDFPGISESDAWWLLLVAFDKPVWPSDPFIDRLLHNLGLLKRSQIDDSSFRHQELEDELSDQQISKLHRALAGHAVKADIDVCSSGCEIRKFLLSYRLRQQKQAEKADAPTVVDLFSGAGGLSLGFARAGFSVELAVDTNRAATDTFRLNHPEIPHERVLNREIEDVLEDSVFEELGISPDVVVGGPPCQSLSVAGYRSRLAKNDDYSVLKDERTGLYEEFVESVERLRPKVFVMENVEGMVNEVHDSGVKVGDLVVNSLESIGQNGTGYVCDYQVVHAASYGIPQKRDRVLFVGVREDMAQPRGNDIAKDIFESMDYYGTSGHFDLRQGLSGIPKLRRGEGGRVIPEQVRGRNSRYVSENQLGDGTSLTFNHQAREHPMEKDQTLFDEALEPGDTGWDVKYAKDGDYSDLIEYDVGTEENPRFKDKYRMLSWDEPAPTVVAHLAKDANNFVIPDYYEYVSQSNGKLDNQRNRGVTPREAARLQSFPDQFIFLGTFTNWFKQVGNAVPPLLGERVGKSINNVALDLQTIPMGMGVETGRATSDD